ncbi:hypothetical protein TSOC_010776 [Tetrabaena socialis]|uniref:3'-5' exonuclease domain-containing protein n=1 Tax=Tetrabaena socialis TaxID=47790 RepID=A0A2J7ZSD1_9CHLO|nr:hypothetical protein TSOC_010776 [Tetrabaena socialis]|eukprot:PNH03175.1 hypothetical protein TSOC_010776 [Tetrabaena socialis]
MYNHHLMGQGQASLSSISAASLPSASLYGSSSGMQPEVPAYILQQYQQASLLLGPGGALYGLQQQYSAGALEHAVLMQQASDALQCAPSPGAQHMGAAAPAHLRHVGRQESAAPSHRQTKAPLLQQHPASADAAAAASAAHQATPLKALVDWRGTFSATIQPHDVLPLHHPDKGTPGLSELRLGAFEVLLAETPQAGDVAVETLRARMWDGIVALDAEWKPDTARGESNPIALLQLSSAGLVVVIRTLVCGLPVAFRTAIVEDSDVELVVAGWSGNDERKFEESFGLQVSYALRGEEGCKIAELQKIAKTCGHSKTGVKALVQAVLEPSMPMPKSKKQSTFDWSAPVLPNEQLKYAVLDAVCTEHVFRCLEGKF